MCGVKCNSLVIFLGKSEYYNIKFYELYQHNKHKFTVCLSNLETTSNEMKTLRKEVIQRRWLRIIRLKIRQISNKYPNMTCEISTETFKVCNFTNIYRVLHVWSENRAHISRMLLHDKLPSNKKYRRASNLSRKCIINLEYPSCWPDLASSDYFVSET